ncbi:hypothetical protein PSP6_540008 [Paraburkholderia tropica]|uniref:hypothetical protein n=1 Tax=Paraburkholderia tropica TaxID=92647 RepID=UPI001CB1DA86|nr:hypothetical protein [Paraburkholderia tropica]CAG9229874.1 hypothetical protein PSP6_540008 [Paraburkholderia tropica]
MTITTQESRLLEHRDSMAPGHKAAIDAAFSDMCAALRACGLRTATDDRAAAVEAAIVRYVLGSNPTIPGLSASGQ